MVIRFQQDTLFILGKQYMKSKEKRCANAAHVAAERAARTPQQQLAQLDSRCGKNQGAKKERERLLTQINIKKEEAVSEEKPKKKKKKEAESCP